MDGHSINDSRRKLECQSYVNPAYEDETKIADVADRTDEPSIVKTNRSQSEDSGWSWVVCCASFIHFLIYEGVFFSFGLVFIALIEEFNSSKRDTAWIISINISLSLLAGPLASALSVRFGYWIVAILGTLITVSGMLASMSATCIQILYITYGFISGLGHGFLYHASTVCVILSFDKKKALASGIANVGVGIGLFIISPLVETCVKMYGWRGTILIEAGLLLHGIACGLVYRSVKSTATHTDELYVNTEAKQSDVFTVKLNGMNGTKSLYHDKKDSFYNKIVSRDHSSNDENHIGNIKVMLKRIVRTNSDLRLLKSTCFTLFTLSMTLMFFSIYMPYIFIPDFAKSEGIDDSIGALILGASGIGGTVSRILFGWLSDRPWVNMFVVQSMTLILCGITTGLMAFCRSYELLLAAAVMFSTFQACIPVLVSVLIAELVGRGNVSRGFGIICWFSGFSNLLGPPIAGWLFDSFGNYYITFWSFGIVLVFSGTILFVVAYLHRRKKTEILICVK